jgi:hypothetical protein
MLYKVIFEDGEPIKAEEYHTSEKNFKSGEYILSPKGEYQYQWRIIEASSGTMALAISKN